MPTVSTALQKCKFTSAQFLNSSTIDVCDVLGGVVDANGLLHLSIGVDLTVSGSASGGVGCVWELVTWQ